MMRKSETAPLPYSHATAAILAISGGLMMRKRETAPLPYSHATAAILATNGGLYTAGQYSPRDHVINV
jgi:hypothetical protein